MLIVHHLTLYHYAYHTSILVHIYIYYCSHITIFPHVHIHKILLFAHTLSPVSLHQSPTLVSVQDLNVTQHTFKDWSFRSFLPKTWQLYQLEFLWKSSDAFCSQRIKPLSSTSELLQYEGFQIHMLVQSFKNLELSCYNKIRQTHFWRKLGYAAETPTQACKRKRLFTLGNLGLF